jgi:hypothetical protein
MPVRVSLGAAGDRLLRPTTSWQEMPVTNLSWGDVKVDGNFYVLAAAQ